MYHVLKLHNVKCIIGMNDSFTNVMTQQYEIDGKTHVYHATKIVQMMSYSFLTALYRVDDVANNETYYIAVNTREQNSNDYDEIYDVIDDTLNADFDTDALREFATRVENDLRDLTEF